MRRLRPQDKEQIIHLHKQSMSNRRIADQLGLNINKVYECLKREGMIEPKCSRQKKEARIMELYGQGMTIYMIYRTTGSAYRLIKQTLIKHGITPQIRQPALLSPEQEQQIIFHRSQGLSYRKIASITGIPKHQIFLYCRKNKINKKETQQ